MVKYDADKLLLFICLHNKLLTQPAEHPFRTPHYRIVLPSPWHAF